MNNESKIKEKREVYEFLRKQDDLGLIDKSTLNKWAALGVNINPDEKKLPERVCNKPQGQLSIDPEIYEWYTHHHTYDGKHWKPKSVIFHTDEFWNWINSITLGFVTDKIWYEPFEIYKAQAEYFKNTARNPYNDDNMELRREIIMEEYAKIDCNTLYYANHYAQYKEGNSRSGKMPYNAKEHNAIIFFLLDCSYSFILGKPRQIFATTTLGIFITKKLITQENFYMKFITEDDKTGMEILDDKVKTAYGFLPLWMRPQVARDYIRGFRLGKKINKGEYALPNSRIEVLAPSKTAINGGSPQIVFVDEVGNVPDLIPMILEARPTMYVDSNQDGNLTVSRSIVAWGCVCAGTKVWDKDGNVYNIEDLPIDNGILGYNKNYRNASKEDITYWQEAKEKPCVMITTNTGRTLSCSIDHPILTDNRDWVSAACLRTGDNIIVSHNNAHDKYDFNDQEFHNEVVVRIGDLGMKPVYNLTANTTHTYIANGIVTHNTGVSANKGKNAFQSLWTNTLDFWDNKDFKSAMFVPLFFSWHARCSKDVYDAEMRSYYNGDKKDCEGMSQDEQKSIFHMHYPSVWRDMFSMASNKLIPRGIIDEGQTRIRNMAIKDKPVEGFFEPIYDYTVKYDDNVGVPYRVMGAKFVPFDDVNEDRSVISCYMLDRPEYGWKDRYYKGTDPIMTESGGSLFASAVWDAVTCRPACIMNFRRMHDHKAAFLQSLLMGIYYDTDKSPTGIPELVENNIGTNYVDFMQLLGYGRNLVYNAELQHELRGGGALWGINTKSNRKQVSVAKLSECVMTYHKNFAHDVIFRQLDTYVPIVKTTGITYEPVDKRMYKDDVLDSLAFAYICRLTYSHKLPIQLDDARAVKTAPKQRLTRDANNMLILEYRK